MAVGKVARSGEVRWRLWASLPSVPVPACPLALALLDRQRWADRVDAGQTMTSCGQRSWNALALLLTLLFSAGKGGLGAAQTSWGSGAAGEAFMHVLPLTPVDGHSAFTDGETEAWAELTCLRQHSQFGAGVPAQAASWRPALPGCPSSLSWGHEWLELWLQRWGSAKPYIFQTRANRETPLCPTHTCSSPAPLLAAPQRGPRRGWVGGAGQGTQSRSQAKARTPRPPCASSSPPVTPSIGSWRGETPLPQVRELGTQRRTAACPGPCGRVPCAATASAVAALPTGDSHSFSEGADEG